MAISPNIIVEPRPVDPGRFHVTTTYADAPESNAAVFVTREECAAQLERIARDIRSGCDQFQMECRFVEFDRLTSIYLEGGDQ